MIMILIMRDTYCRSPVTTWVATILAQEANQSMIFFAEQNISPSDSRVSIARYLNGGHVNHKAEGGSAGKD